MKALVVCMAAFALGGCSIISPKVGPQLAKAAKKYCEQPYELRMALRTEVNGMIAPNQALIWCEGDPLPKPLPNSQ